MAEQFKPGDCVTLKHGGGSVEMTINTIFDDYGIEKAQCKWFNSQKGAFDELIVSLDALKVCSPT